MLQLTNNMKKLIKIDYKNQNHVMKTIQLNTLLIKIGVKAN